MTIISANEGGSVFITASFADRNEDPVVPNTVEWSLCDGDGNIINSREDVSETPAESVTILLSGDDLPWAASFPTETYFLYLTVMAVYDEVDESDVPQNQEVKIAVANVRCI